MTGLWQTLVGNQVPNPCKSSSRLFWLVAGRESDFLGPSGTCCPPKISIARKPQRFQIAKCKISSLVAEIAAKMAEKSRRFFGAWSKNLSNSAFSNHTAFGTLSLETFWASRHSQIPQKFLSNLPQTFSALWTSRAIQRFPRSSSDFSRSSPDLFPHGQI